MTFSRDSGSINPPAEEDRAQAGNTQQMIFTRMSPQDGERILHDANARPGDFLIRESSTAGMLTIDIRRDNDKYGHVRFQYHTNPQTGTGSWEIVAGAQVEQSVTLFSSGNARQINAENFKTPEIRDSFFARLAALGFTPDKCIYAPDRLAENGYTGYDRVGYENYVALHPAEHPTEPKP